MRKKFFTSAFLILAMSFMVGCSDDSSDNGSSDSKGQQYKQKILVEDITSASCVWCPLAAYTTEELAKTELSDRIISVAAHGNFDKTMVADPFVLPTINKLLSTVKLQGWPFVAWNRNLSIGGSQFQTAFLRQTKNEAGVVQWTFDANLFKKFYTRYNLFTEGSPIGIKIASNLSNTEGKVNISVKFGEDMNQELKYVIYVLEDGLKFKQANASSLFGNTSGTARWETNFIHDHVVRATNDFAGEPIAANEAVTTNEFKASADLTYTVENLANTSVVVAILDKDGKVLNAQKAKANATQDYEKL